MANDAYAEMRLQRADRLAQARRLGRLLASLAPPVSKERLAARLLLVDCMLFQGLADFSSRRGRVGRQLINDFQAWCRQASEGHNTTSAQGSITGEQPG